MNKLFSISALAFFCCVALATANIMYAPKGMMYGGYGYGGGGFSPVGQGGFMEFFMMSEYYLPNMHNKTVHHRPASETPMEWDDGGARLFAQYNHIRKNGPVEWRFAGGPMEARDCMPAGYWPVHEKTNYCSRRQVLRHFPKLSTKIMYDISCLICYFRKGSISSAAKDLGQFPIQAAQILTMHN